MPTDRHGNERRSKGKVVKGTVKEFVISDTHFFHANIIKYCSRPFADVEEMNTVMVNNWNSVVSPDDTVFHVGDFSFGKIENVAAIRKQLNGKIILILGNHDRNPRQMKESGIDEAYNKLVIVRRDRTVLFHHRPWIGPFPQRFHIYGHVHNSGHMPPPRSYNASVEVNNYTPRLLDEILEEISGR